MKLSVKNAIYQSIVKGKWLSVSYVNRNNEPTEYYVGIQDLDIEKGTLCCDIFNPFKKDVILTPKQRRFFIYIDRIKRASVLEHSYCDVPEDLIKKVSTDKAIGEYLEVVNFDNNILQYLSDCYRLDNDPYLKETIMIDDIDLHTLTKEKEYSLDEDQFRLLLDRVFKKNYLEAEQISRYQTLAINRFSIDIGGKQYVVAYRTLNLNFKKRTLKLSADTHINKSFLITADKRVTLWMYLEMSPEEFVANYDKNEQEYIEAMKENFINGEIVNTRPNIFLLSRSTQRGVEEAFEAISEMDAKGQLTHPLKAFFGRNRILKGNNKGANIVVFDKNKINIDQMRVLYNAMANHITYVKGPPGTGKTETIFNVLLSSYVNGKTVLVCSNNNHPVNDIFKKMNATLGTNEDSIPFPILRIGNNVETHETIKRLRSVFNFVEKNRGKAAEREAAEESTDRFLSEFEKLKNLLAEYEARVELQEKIDTLQRIQKITSIPQVDQKLEEQINAYVKELNESREIENKEVLECATSASEDQDFRDFLNASALARYRKLENERFGDLIEILEISDLEEAVVALNKYLRDEGNFKLLLSVFPIIVCTNLSCAKLGSPNPHFDLIIMDESGQCNIASSLIPMVRGKDLLLVGDTDQLQPVTVLEENINDDLRHQYGVGEEYDYIKNSILSTMLRKDSNSKNILLRYHYRCGTKIASFVNQRFYNQQLKLANHKPGSLLYCKVENTSNAKYRNAYDEEAASVARLIKENGYKDVGIITPFVNQAALINDYLAKYHISNVKAGTIHTLQGSEKSTIILSSALSYKTGKKTMEWIKNNHELINVGVTRAKDRLIFVGDKEAIDALSGGESNDLKVLSDYVYKNGETIVPKSENTLTLDFSNNSKNEAEFFKTVEPYFHRRGSKFRIERNVKVKGAIKGIQEEDLDLVGKKEFDVIVQAKGGFIFKTYQTIVVFEIDGGEHVGRKKTAMLDRQKEEVCKRYGIKLIRISSQEVKDYEYIIRIFECIANNLKDMDEAFGQMSLFGDEQ